MTLLVGALLAVSETPFALAQTPPASAQATTVRIDTGAVTVRMPPPGALERFRRDADFQYERAAPEGRSWWNRFWDGMGELLAPAFSEELSPLRRWLFYGMLAAILVFAALRLLQMSPRGLFRRRQSRHSALSFEEIEEDLGAADLEPLLEEAVAAGNYRRAVRLLYLRALQQLAARGLIRWRLDKTNRAYVEELQPAGLDASFARLTDLFEVAWYGDTSLNRSVFERVRGAFEDFQRRLGAYANSDL